MAAQAPARAREGRMQFSSYQTEGFYDEMFQADGAARPHYQLVHEIVQSLSDGQLLRYKHAAERLLLQLGITFNVYGDTAGTERIFPFDLIPRIVPAHEWERIERGLKQRIHALNAFIGDIYHDQKILKDGAIPAEVVTSAVSYRQQCHGLNPPWGVWCHVTGTDLVRAGDGEYYVLEDNLRVPSGIYNSAYFEHSFLAQQMGVQLVEGRDLVVSGGDVFTRTTKGLERVDVIYRRVDDDFLDPNEFRADSMLGVPGLMAAYRAGRVALANAPGNGV